MAMSQCGYWGLQTSETERVETLPGDPEKHSE
jgi:hypothetical protein